MFEMIRDILELIGQYGLPIVLVVYFIIKRDKVEAERVKDARLFASTIAKHGESMKKLDLILDRILRNGFSKNVDKEQKD